MKESFPTKGDKFDLQYQLRIDYEGNTPPKIIKFTATELKVRYGSNNPEEVNSEFKTLFPGRELMHVDTDRAIGGGNIFTFEILKNKNLKEQSIRKYIRKEIKSILKEDDRYFAGRGDRIDLEYELRIPFLKNETDIEPELIKFTRTELEVRCGITPKEVDALFKKLFRGKKLKHVDTTQSNKGGDIFTFKIINTGGADGYTFKDLASALMKKNWSFDFPVKVGIEGTSRGFPDYYESNSVKNKKELVVLIIKTIKAQYDDINEWMFYVKNETSMEELVKNEFDYESMYGWAVASIDEDTAIVVEYDEDDEELMHL